MPLQVSDVATLHDYLVGVVNRADHHADNVRHVVLPLVGAVVLFKDPDTPIHVRTQDGVTANVLWMEIGGSKYALSYDHQAQCIVIKRGSVRGAVLARFTNESTVPEILAAFETLRNAP